MRAMTIIPKGRQYTCRSGNVVTIGRECVAQAPAAAVDLVWNTYPPTVADMRECMAWIQSLIPKSKSGGHFLDPTPPQS